MEELLGIENFNIIQGMIINIMNNRLIPYKENIFTKISNLFKNLFLEKRKLLWKIVMKNLFMIYSRKILSLKI